LGLFKKNSNTEEGINAEIVKAPSISPQELFDKTNSKESIFLFDFRPDDEFSKGHIATSQKIPASELDAGKLKSMGVVKTSDIVLVNSGDDVLETARKTNEFLKSGFVNTKYLEGGINKWKNQGFLLISSGGLEEDASKVKRISLDELATNLGAGANMVQFVDVRDGNNFASGHVAGALNIPLSEIEKNRKDISLVEKVVVYGASAEEASKAATILFDLNYFNAWVLDGGLDAWKNAGGKIETGK
jgi:rhodanese-related sulfurtransferase